MRFFCVLLLSIGFTLGAPVPGFPIGRCVKVLGVTAPEDAAKVGFEYVELALQDTLALDEVEFAKLVTRIRSLGIPALSGYGFLPADMKIVGPEVNTAELDRMLTHSMARAVQLGLKMVVYGNLNSASRQAPEGYALDLAMKQVVDFGQRAAKEAGKHGIFILFEPMPTRNTNTVNTVAEGIDLVRKVHHPNFGLLVDFSYMTQGKEDMAILKTAAKYIRQVEISNPNGRVYPKLATEADYAGFFRILKQSGYKGGFSIHGAPTDFFADAPQAISMLQGLLRE